MVSRRQVLGGGVGLWILPMRAAVAAGGTQPAKPVRIANAAGSLNLSMAALMAQEKFLESFGVAPNILAVRDGSKILSAIVAGSVDLSTMAGFGQLFPAVERGAQLKVIAGAAMRPSLALFSARPGITSLEQLEGKTVGTGSFGALLHQLTVALLRKYKIDVSKVRFVNIGSSTEVLRAVRAGVVDAGPGEAAFIGRAHSLGIHVLDHGNMVTELPQFTYQGAWTSDTAIKGKRDTLVRTLAAYAKLYRFVQKPEAKDAFIRARRSLFPNAALQDHLAQWDFIQTYKPFATDLVVSDARLDYMQKLNQSFKIQSRILPPSQVSDMTLARDALALLAGSHRPSNRPVDLTN